VVARTDVFDLGRLQLRSGAGRRLELAVPLDPLDLSGERYEMTPNPVPVRLDVSRTTGNGYALRLRFQAAPAGPCMRCLRPAASMLEVDAREVSQPGGGDELTSPYVHDEDLDLAAWARDALALALPAALLCRPDCRGLCPECGADLNEAGPEHRHEKEPDPRWAALRELRPGG
jgi:uncharacterized protein